MTPMLILKPGVDPTHLTPEMLLGIEVVKCVYFSRGYDCVITSLGDGKHGENSLHTRDGIVRATDFRTNHVSRMELTTMVEEARAHLGHHYDVVLEALNQDNEHLHVEFDHKTSA